MGHFPFWELYFSSLVICSLFGPYACKFMCDGDRVTVGHVISAICMGIIPGINWGVAFLTCIIFFVTIMSTFFEVIHDIFEDTLSIPITDLWKKRK